MKRKTTLIKEGKTEFSKFRTEVSNYWKGNSTKIAKKASRRFRQYTMRKLICHNGTLKIAWKRLKFREYMDHLGIRGKVVGFTEGYIGVQTAKPVVFRNLCAEYLDSGIEGLYPKGIVEAIQSSSYNYREVYQGSWHTNTGHWREIFAENTTVFKCSDLLEVMLECPWFNAPVVEFDDPREMYTSVNFNPKSHSGHYTSQIFGGKEKGLSHKACLSIALAQYKYIRTVPVDNFSLWSSFAREKDNKLTKSSFSTRAVVGTEDSSATIFSWVCQKIQASYSKFGNTPDLKFHLEGEFNGEKAYNLTKRIMDYDYVVDADWTFFDASSDSVYIEASAIAMLSNVPYDDRSKRFLYHNIISMVRKFIAIPPGLVVEVGRATPSGHPCVTIINCINNLIRWAQIGKAIYGEEYWNFMDIEVYGDDAVVMFKAHPDLVYIDKIIKDLGFRSDPIYPNLFPVPFFNCSAEADNTPDFLKRRISLSPMRWNRVKLVDKLLYQSKKRSPQQQYDLCHNFLNTAPGDQEMNCLLVGMMKFIQKQDPTIKSIPSIERTGKFEYYMSDFISDNDKDHDRFNSGNISIFNRQGFLKGSQKEVDILRSLFVLTLSNQDVNKYRRFITDSFFYLTDNETCYVGDVSQMLYDKIKYYVEGMKLK